MRTQPLNFVGGAYADEARPWASQDVCNWLPTQAEAENTLTPAKYETPPGLKPFAEAGTGVVRGIHDAEGRLFTVIGNQLYQISNSGVAIPRGGIPDVRRVQMAHNQITGGNEVLVVNGSAGFIWNTATNTFNKITDPGYPGAISAIFIDGYFVQIEPGRRYALNSDLADGLSYNTLDRFTSEVSPDELVGLASSNNELLLLSDSSGEFFENTGAAQQPFRSKRIAINKGCAGTHTIVTLDNTVFWLGNDGYFYMLEGYTPRRISVRPIEQAIRGLNWSQAFAFIWEDSGHSVCYWTFPDGQTWGYDASSGKWHRRSSKGLNRWRVNCTTHSNRRWIAGDFQRGRLWEIDWDYQLEGDEEIERECTGAVVYDNQSRVRMPRLEVLIDAGQEPTVAIPFPAQPTGPSISGAAPDGLLDEAYSGYAYTITAGDAPINSVKIVTGALPAGLTLDDDGVIDTGVTTELGPDTYTIRVTDTNGLWAELTDTIDILFNLGEWAFTPADFQQRAYVEVDPATGNTAAITYGGADRLYNTAGGAFTTYQTTNPIQPVGIAWSPELELFATTSDASNGRYYTSEVGAEWDLHTSLITSDRRGMTWSPDIGEFATMNDPNIVRSVDGVTWTFLDVGASGSETIRWSPIKDGYIAAGTGVYSSNSTGTVFTPRTESGSLYTDIAESDDLIVIVGAAIVLTSTDGITFASHVPPVTFACVEWCGFINRFVAAGVSGDTIVIYSNDDPETESWILEATLDTTAVPYDMACADVTQKIYLAVNRDALIDNGGIYTCG